MTVSSKRLSNSARLPGGRDVSLTTLSIAWVMANPVITSAILGASKPEQLTDSLAAADFSIDAELKKQLDELTAEYRHGDALR